MRWTGKIVGGLLGLWLFGWFGALLGILIGHQFDSGSIRVSSQAHIGQVQALFLPALFRVMGHVAKSDGRISEQEVAAARAIMHALRLSPDQIQAAIEYYSEGKRPEFDLAGAIRELQPAVRPNPQLAQFFMEIQLQAALAGNGLAPLPRARLIQVAALLGMGSGEFARLEAIMRYRSQGAWTRTETPGGPQGRHDGEAISQAYALLEATPAATDAELKKAYRRQMSKHHPDKLQSQGLPESMLERAKERTQQIQAAYELLCKQRGMP
jgi:DnaJ like chaperone protein